MTVLITVHNSCMCMHMVVPTGVNDFLKLLSHSKHFLSKIDSKDTQFKVRQPAQSGESAYQTLYIFHFKINSTNRFNSDQTCYRIR